MQLRVIWNPVLQPDPEGPTLISHAAWRSRTTPEVVPSHLRGAQSSACRGEDAPPAPPYRRFMRLREKKAVRGEPSPRCLFLRALFKHLTAARP